MSPQMAPTTNTSTSKTHSAATHSSDLEAHFNNLYSQAEASHNIWACRSAYKLIESFYAEESINFIPIAKAVSSWEVTSATHHLNLQGVKHCFDDLLSAENNKLTPFLVQVARCITEVTSRILSVEILMLKILFRVFDQMDIPIPRYEEENICKLRRTLGRNLKEKRKMSAMLDWLDTLY